MTYTRNLKNLIPFIIFHLIPIILAILILFEIISLGVETDIWLLILGSVLVYVLGLILIPGKFIRNSLNFVKCETTEEGLDIVLKSGHNFVFWEQIDNIKFEYKFLGRTGGVNIIFGKSFGSFIITDKLKNEIELTSAIENRDLLIQEIISKCNLEERFRGLAGRSSSGYAYWERVSPEEFNLQKDEKKSKVEVFKTSSISDYLIVAVVFIVIMILGVYIADFLRR